MNIQRGRYRRMKTLHPQVPTYEGKISIYLHNILKKDGIKSGSVFLVLNTKIIGETYKYSLPICTQ